jgi:hypothetical protein
MQAALDLERWGDAALRLGAARQREEVGIWSSLHAWQGRRFECGVELVRRDGAWTPARSCSAWVWSHTCISGGACTLLGRGGSPLDGGDAGSSGGWRSWRGSQDEEWAAAGIWSRRQSSSIRRKRTPQITGWGYVLVDPLSHITLGWKFRRRGGTPPSVR